MRWLSQPCVDNLVNNNLSQPDRRDNKVGGNNKTVAKFIFQLIKLRA